MIPGPMDSLQMQNELEHFDPLAGLLDKDSISDVLDDPHLFPTFEALPALDATSTGPVVYRNRSVSSHIFSADPVASFTDATASVNLDEILDMQTPSSDSMVPKSLFKLL
jgi:hypothetical protein